MDHVSKTRKDPWCRLGDCEARRTDSRRRPNDVPRAGVEGSEDGPRSAAFGMSHCALISKSVTLASNRSVPATSDAGPNTSLEGPARCRPPRRPAGRWAGSAACRTAGCGAVTEDGVFNSARRGVASARPPPEAEICEVRIARRHDHRRNRSRARIVEQLHPPVQGVKLHRLVPSRSEASWSSAARNRSPRPRSK